MRAKSGFTLVEILIVVVILGILAAIVIPQFTGASTEAKESALVSDLQSVRSQIELYKIQHNDNLPGQDASGTFIAAMTSVTDQDGNVDPGAGDPAVYRFGPYMRKVPVNPFSVADPDTNLVREEAGVSTAGADTHHWVFNTGTGEFQADDDEVNAVTGDAHTTY